MLVCHDCYDCSCVQEGGYSVRIQYLFWSATFVGHVLFLCDCASYFYYLSGFSTSYFLLNVTHPFHMDLLLP